MKKKNELEYYVETLTITGISNEKKNELEYYVETSQYFRDKNFASLCQVQEKLKACRGSKLSFISSCFIADGSHVKIVWLHVAAFSERDILHF